MKPSEIILIGYGSVLTFLWTLVLILFPVWLIKLLIQTIF